MQLVEPIAELIVAMAGQVSVMDPRNRREISRSSLGARVQS